MESVRREKLQVGSLRESLCAGKTWLSVTLPLEYRSCVMNEASNRSLECFRTNNDNSGGRSERLKKLLKTFGRF